MSKILKVLLAIVALIAITAWGVCAIYYGDSSTSTLQSIFAIEFGISGLLALLALAIPALRYRPMILQGLLFIGVLVWWLNIAPSNTRRWQADVEKLAFATFEENSITVHNIRNFDYSSEFDYRPAYYTKTFDLDKLEGVDLFAIYWMGPAIAHTIISFNFGEGNHLAVSIEARKEKNEGYSTIKGFFRQFELIYIAADERDVIRLRTNYRENPQEAVYLYSMHGQKENAKRVFLDYINNINDLNKHPAFYKAMSLLVVEHNLFLT